MVALGMSLSRLGNVKTNELKTFMLSKDEKMKSIIFEKDRQINHLQLLNNERVEVCIFF